MRLHLEDDPRVDETWLELVVQDLWDMVKRVRRTKGRREERYTLVFDATEVEVVMRRVRP